MPIVECGRTDCMYNEKNLCGGQRIALRKGRCLSYVAEKELRRLMTGTSPGVHRERGKLKNNTGRVIR